MAVTADLAFLDGAVLTGQGSMPSHTSVAVRGDRIIAVGPQVQELIGTGTEVVHLAGRLLSPGFVDAHVHPVFAGLERAQCDLTELADVASYLAAIGDYARAHPELPWIAGSGWSMGAFPAGVPNRRDLDAVVPDRPVYLTNSDHHGAWVNSRALELAGIRADTPDPADGRIEREPDGTPCGMLQEAAGELVARLLPEPLTAEIDAALLDAQSVLHSFGVTGWQDAIVGSYLGRPDPFEAYLRAANSGALSARVVGALWWDRTRGLEQVDELLERRERARAGRFRAGTVKIMQDGIAETGTAALLGPYLDACGCVTANSGESFIDPVALNGYVRELDRLGFQLHFHALGDRAVREALDALEAAAEANGPRERRHHLAHLQVVDPGDIPRFAALGAIANLQTLWATHDVEMDELTIPFLGPERSRLQYPFASLLRAGATLAAGSDWPVSSPDPLAAIHVAVNRIGPGSGAAAFLPDQAIGLAAAFRAYTRGSAHVNGDDEGGVIQAGAPADLVLLDRDPFAGPAGEIAATRALATYVGGHRVFAADAF